MESVLSGLDDHRIKARAHSLQFCRFIETAISRRLQRPGAAATVVSGLEPHECLPGSPIVVDVSVPRSGAFAAVNTAPSDGDPASAIGAMLANLFAGIDRAVAVRCRPLNACTGAESQYFARLPKVLAELWAAASDSEMSAAARLYSSVTTNIVEIFSTTGSPPGDGAVAAVGDSKLVGTAKRWVIFVPTAPTISMEWLFQRCDLATEIVPVFSAAHRWTARRAASVDERQECVGWVLMFASDEDAFRAFAAGMHSAFMTHTSPPRRESQTAEHHVATSCGVATDRIPSFDCDHDPRDVVDVFAGSSPLSPSRHRNAVRVSLMLLSAPSAFAENTTQSSTSTASAASFSRCNRGVVYDDTLVAAAPPFLENQVFLVVAREMPEAVQLRGNQLLLHEIDSFTRRARQAIDDTVALLLQRCGLAAATAATEPYTTQVQWVVNHVCLWFRCWWRLYVAPQNDVAPQEEMNSLNVSVVWCLYALRRMDVCSDPQSLRALVFGDAAANLTESKVIRGTVVTFLSDQVMCFYGSGDAIGQRATRLFHWGAEGIVVCRCETHDVLSHQPHLPSSNDTTNAPASELQVRLGSCPLCAGTSHCHVVLRASWNRPDVVALFRIFSTAWSTIAASCSINARSRTPRHYHQRLLDVVACRFSRCTARVTPSCRRGYAVKLQPQPMCWRCAATHEEDSVASGSSAGVHREEVARLASVETMLRDTLRECKSQHLPLVTLTLSVLLGT